MAYRDGYDRSDRLKRLTALSPFAVVDNSKASLLRQLLEIAGRIKYYNQDLVPDNYFDKLLDELRTVQELTSKKKSYDPGGQMEPSQALLLAFVENLQRVTGHYNERWNNLPGWYLNDFLKVKPLPVTGDRVWLSFVKNTPDPVTVEKNFGFIAKDSRQEQLYYRMAEALEVHDIDIAQAWSIYFERNHHRVPASQLGYVTAIKIKDLLAPDASRQKLLFGKQQSVHDSKAVGIKICAPALLLREGKREVTIRLHSEHSHSEDGSRHAENEPFEPQRFKWVMELQQAIDTLKTNGDSEDKIRFDLFNNLFYLTISTTEGWTNIPVFVVRQHEDSLILKFVLPEEFPATVPCNEEQHFFSSHHPALRIHLNFDAWLYPYSWMKDFMLQKIAIRTHVEGINNVLVYNELGKIDNSKPFPPFGINTEQGAWLAVGNYEMAIKNATEVNLVVEWNQLPNNPRGLEGHYEAYKAHLTNRSFRVRSRYLTDYKWHETQGKSQFTLFQSTLTDEKGRTLPDAPLASESRFDNISIKKMTIVNQPEESYDYTIKSRAGFIRLTMEEPEGGFGEQRFRQLFAERMMMKKWRKKRLKSLNPPIAPMVEKITLDYIAEDDIDLRIAQPEDGPKVYQLYPFGHVSSFGGVEKNAVPLVFSQDTDASIMLGMTNVKGGETLSLYLDFHTISNEFSSDELPQVVMYWGDGYHWEPVPEGFILQDETNRMLISGNLQIRFPYHIYPSMYDKEGLLWIRAGIAKNAGCIPGFKGIYPNAGKVVLQIDDPEAEKWNGFKTVNGPLEPEKKLPGIVAVNQVTPFYAGQEREDQLQMQARISEYVTHRGRAVTPRDYERLTLQAFPDIGKVKCLPDYNIKNAKKGVVTLVVVPRAGRADEDYRKPVAHSGLMATIEDYFKKRSSGSAYIDVINPVYEELMVKCSIRFRQDAHSPMLGVQLKAMFDQLIAPWQKSRHLPKFGAAVSVSRLYDQLRQAEFVEAIDYFSVVRVSEERGGYNVPEYHTLYEYGKGTDLIEPSEPYTVFVPAESHIIHLTEGRGDSETPFGIGDMEVGKSFII